MICGMLWICPEPYHRNDGGLFDLQPPWKRVWSGMGLSLSACSGDRYSKYWTFNCTPIEQLNVCERQNTRRTTRPTWVNYSLSLSLCSVLIPIPHTPYPIPIRILVLSPIPIPTLTPTAIPITVLQAVLKKGVTAREEQEERERGRGRDRDRKRPKLLRARFVAQFKWLEKVQNY